MDSQNKKFYLKIALILLAVAYFLYRSPKSTGSVYCPDMAYSRAYETYGDNGPIATLFGSTKSNMASLMPVANTFSRGSLPTSDLLEKEPSSVYSYQYTRFFQNTDTDKARAGAELKNPYTNDPDVLKRGEAVYVKQCAICHGTKGMGDGPLIVREDGSEGAYKAVPPTYADRLKTLKDGEIFHSITYGKNLMGGYASHVNADDRWKLVCYIKELGGLNGGATAAPGAVSIDSASMIAKK
jgi:mono/diheme cytochrome c family protein